ncbi:hypothetical protein X777_16105 [Ooceraea biroi]|uniref:Uncharacterized protein n=1 Tax=Ooceraea biroi TaxID=2015173 RepID=A0A026WV57_OOCBI|nr:hypothetical protein X777_16105 [Ooceraea biroi]
MVERWVKSAVSPDWTVILGWGTFWIPAANSPRKLPLIAPPWKLPYRRGKALSPFPTSPSPLKISLDEEDEGTTALAYIPESLRNSDLVETTRLGKFPRDEKSLNSEIRFGKDIIDQKWTF